MLGATYRQGGTTPVMINATLQGWPKSIVIRADMPLALGAYIWDYCLVAEQYQCILCAALALYGHIVICDGFVSLTNRRDFVALLHKW